MDGHSSVEIQEEGDVRVRHETVSFELSDDAIFCELKKQTALLEVLVSAHLKSEEARRQYAAVFAEAVSRPIPGISPSKFLPEGDGSIPSDV